MFRFSAHIGYLFTELPLEERMEAAARNGFSAVEHPNPYAIPAGEMARLLDAAGVPMAQIAAPPGDPARGEKGIACFDDRGAEFRDSVARGLDYAQAIGCTRLHIMAGIVPPGPDSDRAWPVYLDNLAHAAGQARAYGITILIEPIGPGTVDNYFIARPAQALSAIDWLETEGHPNVALLLDTFHVTDAGLDLLATLDETFDRIGHLHLADHPGRHEPGTGAIPFGRIFEMLLRKGYDGFVGCEYKPAGDTLAGLGWMKAPGVQTPPRSE